ncbi:MAG: hypothetical protein GXN95_00215 [Methanococci archaeon]|uniref:HEPN domain-containing protein n=1 Tax=Methanocaldococcus vulcanius (strain ATCC 700851 / DSM 12094 / M7) TaxID=579137 RepID=C9RHL4_METVM|nr:hypothetical protein [Methanocaldococcus vulcanius]ACX73066.1 conserved hypothetical protein [Methanocaldococcus vulcanius M7]NPA61963.1 hypothetical protein [Methanococci archaeon]
MHDLNDEYLKECIHFLESCINALKDFDLRTFVSRFYYGVLYLLNAFEYNIKKDVENWHNKDRYLNFSKKIRNFLMDLKLYRHASDYILSPKLEHGKHYEEHWEEFKESYLRLKFFHYLHILRQELYTYRKNQLISIIIEKLEIIEKLLKLYIMLEE